MQEDEDDLDATREVHRFLTTILEAGHQIDMIVVWADDVELDSVEVNVHQVAEEEFLFPSNTYLTFLS